MPLSERCVKQSSYGHMIKVKTPLSLYKLIRVFAARSLNSQVNMSAPFLENQGSGAPKTKLRTLGSLAILSSFSNSVVSHTFSPSLAPWLRITKTSLFKYTEFFTTKKKKIFR